MPWGFLKQRRISWQNGPESDVFQEWNHVHCHSKMVNNSEVPGDARPWVLFLLTTAMSRGWCEAQHSTNCRHVMQQTMEGRVEVTTVPT